MSSKLGKIIFFASLVLLLAAGVDVKAANIGDMVIFNIEQAYDLSSRSQTAATLRKLSQNLYFYIEDFWWESLTVEKQNLILDSLSALGEEFDTKIYPTLAQTFGEEWRPGIDKDTRITILLHPMVEKAGGYWNSSDEYPKSQVPNSNEREMIYLNSNTIDSVLAKVELAHELQHLISFNQKTRIRGVVEDVWFNESRSEYASTLLGYENVYEGSNLQQRVKNFLDKPYDSLTEWQNKSYDYGVANLFTQYLVEHYGVAILTQSMTAQKAGIASINEVLSKLGFQEDLSQIFTNWLIASYINNCDLGQIYCYLSPNLKNFRVTPLTNFLPLSGQSTLSIVNVTKDWAGNWFKFAGGKGALKIEFTSDAGANFKVPYVVTDMSGATYLNLIDLGGVGKGTISIDDFGIKISSVTIMPSVRNKTSGFTDSDPAYQFSWTAESSGEIPPPNPSSSEDNNIRNLISQIESLKKQIQKLQEQLLALKGGGLSCQKFEQNLYFGLTNNSEVKCLQEFLENRPGIYPEGIVNGNFLSLTLQAVKRYQASQGLPETGFFGPLTRTAVNKELLTTGR